MTGQKLSEDSFWNVQTNYPQALSLIDTDALTIHHQVYFALLFYECIKESFFPFLFLQGNFTQILFFHAATKKDRDSTVANIVLAPPPPIVESTFLFQSPLFLRVQFSE